jgi:hypothetical protein
MSNFQTFALITEGNISTAANMFIASTTDSLATMLAAGYMDDLSAKIKSNDIVIVNYADLSVFPLNTGESCLQAQFKVSYNPSAAQWSLIQVDDFVDGIAAYGVISNLYTNAGGSATSTIVDARINPSMIVVAAWSSSANAVSVYSVNPGVGSMTVVSSSDPGASVLNYIAFNPSVALEALGVFGGRYTNAGGSATVTIADADITTDMEVNVNFVSQTNASIVQKVTVTAGVLTVLCSADPGVSVLAYMAVEPSSALTTLGLYAANDTGAGGSATVTVTDANIAANSVITANWATSANAVNIQKITAAAGSFAVVSSADPGASVLSYIATLENEGPTDSDYLVSTNNLSDVADVSTSRDNLGVGSTQNVTFNQVIQAVGNITAGTTQTQAGATAITTPIVVVTTGNASDGVILPALSASLIGSRVQLINASANAGVVYCPGTTSTNTINGTAGATGVAYAASKTLFLVAVSATAWVSTLSN